MCFFRCDQQTKLSSPPETKGALGGKKKEKKKLRHCSDHIAHTHTCGGSHARARPSQGQGANINIYIQTHTIYISRPPLSTLQPSAKRCQTHICAEKMNRIPEPSGVKDSLVKNVVLLDDQTNVPCNVVALAFYATLKESINLHNSGKHALPL